MSDNILNHHGDTAMPIENYRIHPAEALQLGECVGELGGANRFIDLMRRRLSFGMPTLWGRAAFRESDRPDDGRRLLIDVIVDELKDSLALSALDLGGGLSDEVRQFNVGAAWDVTGGWPSPDWDIGGPNLKKEGQDDHERIVEKLRSLCEASGHAPLFDLGRDFGRCIGRTGNVFLAFLDHLQGGWQPAFDAEKISFAKFVEAKDVEQLRDHKLISNNRVARAALTYAHELVGHEYVDYQNGGRWGLAHMELAIDLYSSLWLAYGEVLGAASEIDDLSRKENETAVTPRPYLVERSSTRDDVRLALEYAQRELASEIGAGQPEFIVRFLKYSIDILTKRLWRNEFRGNSGRELQRILGRKIHSDETTKAEKKFASTALSLYHNYRNEAEHEDETFCCSYIEARYFAAGIHVLLDLSDRIMRQRNNDSA